MPRFSILDLAAVRTGGTIAEAYRNTVDLAQHADGWGFTRFWLAEHHNMPGIASAATSVLIRACCRQNLDHSRRIRRRDVAEPLAVGYRRAVRNAGRALSWPH